MTGSRLHARARSASNCSCRARTHGEYVSLYPDTLVSRAGRTPVQSEHRRVKAPFCALRGLAEGSSVLRDSLYCFILRVQYKNDIGGPGDGEVHSNRR
jgi:hypothetical protein